MGIAAEKPNKTHFSKFKPYCGSLLPNPLLNKHRVKCKFLHYYYCLLTRTFLSSGQIGSEGLMRSRKELVIQVDFFVKLNICQLFSLRTDLLPYIIHLAPSGPALLRWKKNSQRPHDSERFLPGWADMEGAR